MAKAAQELARRHHEIDEVWLFGSLARWQAVPGSDADVLLVRSECDLPFLEWVAHYQPDFCGVGVGLFDYARKEAASSFGTRFCFQVEKVKLNPCGVRTR